MTPLPRNTRLSGLEPLQITPESNFVNVGERTNVTGSAQFKKLILEGRLDEAVVVARQQVENGAQVIDVNMDEGLLDSKKRHGRVPEPDRRRARHRPGAGDGRFVEVGSDRGRPENACRARASSIRSLDEGEAELRQDAPLARRYGAAVVVMAFDEQGQADTVERKVGICARAYELLTEDIGFPPEDIIFDPNVFAIATGI